MSEWNKFKVVHEKIWPIGFDVPGLECPYCRKIFAAQTWLMKASYCPNCGKNLWEEDTMLIKGDKRKLYFAMVEAAMAKREAAKALMEEAEETLFKARELLGDEFEKEETHEQE